jgi:hypothetical protein
MRTLLLTIGVFVVTATLYIGAPFATAWGIREAVRTGNSTFLSYAVEWPSVRETLKPDIARIALNLPDPEQDPVASGGLWARFKTYWGRGAVERMVDKYVTPEGLTQLFTLRRSYRDYISGDDDEAKTTPLFDRIARTWARVKRAEFTGLTTFEIDMADKYDPTRLYRGKMRLTWLGWKLTELRVRLLTTARNAIEGIADAERGALQ